MDPIAALARQVAARAAAVATKRRLRAEIRAGKTGPIGATIRAPHTRSAWAWAGDLAMPAPRHWARHD